MNDESNNNLPARPRVVLLFSVWMGCIAVGMGYLLFYAHTPGHAMNPPPRWPDQSRIQLAPDQPTLLMFVHPRCPCSRASLRELQRAATQSGDRLAVRVIFYRPDESTDDWRRSDLWTIARQIPAAVLLTDPGGRTSKQFGVTTSGATLVYTPMGNLAFAGGLTASRGHEGDNQGRWAVTSLTTNASPTPLTRTNVFGCSITAPTCDIDGNTPCKH